MDAIERMYAAAEKKWERLTDAQKEETVARAIIGLGCDPKLSLKAREHIQHLVLRLDDYELIIKKQHDALKHMIAERDGTDEH